MNMYSSGYVRSSGTISLGHFQGLTSPGGRVGSTSDCLDTYICTACTVFTVCAVCTVCTVCTLELTKLELESREQQ